MTERKPANVDFETWIDKQIRVAQERGDFDDLPGSGKPLPTGGDDENWWLRGYLEREGVSGEALLPPPLRLRREAERLRSEAAEYPSERALRDTAEELNRRIVEWLRAPNGPRVHIGPVDVDELAAQWQRARRCAPATPAEPARQDADQRKPWWRTMLGR